MQDLSIVKIFKNELKPEIFVIQKYVLHLHSQKQKNIGTIAQLVEQRTENPCVPGSIPGGTTSPKKRN